MVDLSFGMRSPEVGNWQRFLNSFVDSRVLAESCRLEEDEIYGGMTRLATTAYQIRENISFVPVNVGPGERPGVVGPLTRKCAVAQGFIPFIVARNYTLVPMIPYAPRKIDLIVIHTMEAPDKPETAENVAAWFAGPDAPKASCHYCIDTDSVVQCVRDRDVAWHAPGGNSRGIGLEHAGYARQTAEDWKNPYNLAMLVRSAKLSARLCRLYNIPVEHRTVDELKSKMRGFCGHVDITNAFNNGIGHPDPGKSFPWDDYLALVEANR